MIKSISPSSCVSQEVPSISALDNNVSFDTNLNTRLNVNLREIPIMMFNETPKRVELKHSPIKYKELNTSATKKYCIN